MTTGATLQAAATRRQLPALDPRGNAWVEANAGTGKTKVLTDRIVRLLLDDVPPVREAYAASGTPREHTLGEWAALVYERGRVSRPDTAAA